MMSKISINNCLPVVNFYVISLCSTKHFYSWHMLWILILIFSFIYFITHLVTFYSVYLWIFISYQTMQTFVFNMFDWLYKPSTYMYVHLKWILITNIMWTHSRTYERARCQNIFYFMQCVLDEGQIQ